MTSGLRIKVFEIFFLSLAALPTVVRGQEVLERVDSIHQSGFNSTGQMHVRLFEHHYDVVDMNTRVKRSIPIRDIGKQAADYQLVVGKTRIYLVSRTGGTVYELKLDTLKRLDHSYEHRMQAHSVLFTRGDTIYRHGGYGFWSARNMLIFFDPKSREWELARTGKSSEAPPGLFSQHAWVYGNDFWVFGGWQINPADGLDLQENKEVWRYDFTTLNWTKVGETRNPDILPTGSAFYNFAVGDALVIIANNRTSLLASPATNELRTFKANQSNLYHIQSRHLPDFESNGRVYFYRHILNQHQFEFCSLPAKDFFGPQVTAESLYYQSSSPRYWYWALGILPLGVLWFLYQRRNRKADEEAQAQLSPMEFNEIETTLVNHFLSCRPEPVTSEVLDQMLGTQTKSRDVQNQKRSQMLRSVNMKFTVLTGEQEKLIQSNRSSQDGRSMEYFLNDACVEKLKILVS